MFRRYSTAYVQLEECGSIHIRNNVSHLSDHTVSQSKNHKIDSSRQRSGATDFGSGGKEYSGSTNKGESADELSNMRYSKGVCSVELLS